MTRLEREKLAFQHTTALDRGDMETVAAILQIAEDDTWLAAILEEINQEFQEEILRRKPSPPLDAA